jgi:hypothetical protein
MKGIPYSASISSTRQRPVGSLCFARIDSRRVATGKLVIIFVVQVVGTYESSGRRCDGSELQSTGQRFTEDDSFSKRHIDRNTELPHRRNDGAQRS